MKNCDTIHQLLIKLRSRFRPSDIGRRNELIQQYRQLQKTPKDQNIESWLQQWERTYQKCQEINLWQAHGDQPIWDFLKAIEPLSPSFHSIWFHKLMGNLDPEVPTIDMFHLIETYRQYRAQSLTLDRKASHSAFPATFQGLSQDESHQQPKQNAKTCLCGKNHRFRDCWYLIKSKRPSNWTPNQRIEREINDKINRSAKLKVTIDRILQEQEKQLNQASTEAQNDQKNDSIVTEAFTTAFYTNTSSADAYELRDSVLLDSGATIHVCNDKRRFITFRQDQTGGKLQLETPSSPSKDMGRSTSLFNHQQDQRLFNYSIQRLFHHSTPQ